MKTSPSMQLRGQAVMQSQKHISTLIHVSPVGYQLLCVCECVCVCVCACVFVCNLHVSSSLRVGAACVRGCVCVCVGVCVWVCVCVFSACVHVCVCECSSLCLSEKRATQTWGTSFTEQAG